MTVQRKNLFINQLILFNILFIVCFLYPESFSSFPELLNFFLPGEIRTIIFFSTLHILMASLN